jgi:Mg-chelatase subunit ChlD
VHGRPRAILGSLTRPMLPGSAPWAELPPNAEHVDFDLEATLDEGGTEPWASFRVTRRQAVVLSVDTSLSMTGEKLALTAVALAVVLLQFPHEAVGIVAFENEAKVLKRPDEELSVAELVERFMDVPAQGYTHLEDGLRLALKLSSGLPGRVSTVILTDGKYTAGRDPGYLASRFAHLEVLKMGKERASLELCRELAHKGHGSLREVGDLESLPQAMYSVVKDLLKGVSYER